MPQVIKNAKFEYLLDALLGHTRPRIGDEGITPADPATPAGVVPARLIQWPTADIFHVLRITCTTPGGVARLTWADLTCVQETAAVTIDAGDGNDHEGVALASGSSLFCFALIFSGPGDGAPDGSVGLSHSSSTTLPAYATSGAGIQHDIIDIWKEPGIGWPAGTTDISLTDAGDIADLLIIGKS